jgi:hypothetical protein
VRATEFEHRHQTLLSQLLIACGLATYLIDPEDIVWRFIKDNPNRRELEHTVFFVAAVLIGAGAVLCTRAQASPASTDYSQSSTAYRSGEILYAVGLGTLMPLAGFVILVGGQVIRVLRLAGSQLRVAEQSGSGWASAIRHEAAKWGLLVTMIIFTVSLVDRHADFGAGASYALWALLNKPWRKATIR